MRALLIFLFIFISVALVTVKADVAPDRGFTRKKVSLTIEADSNIKGYRFFLISAVSIDEIKFNLGQPVEISAENRVGLKRSASLYAFRSDQVPIDLEVADKRQISKDILSKGEILFSHNFVADLPYGEADSWTDFVYRIEKDDEGKLNSVLIAGGSGIKQEGKYSDTFGVSSAGRKLMPYAITGIVASICLAVGLSIIGIMLIKRSRKKNEN